LSVILFAIFGVIIIQLATVFHELGHAIPAVIFSNDKVRMILGNKRMNRKIKINKLLISIRSFEPFTGFVCYNAKNLKEIQSILIYIGGPVFSLIIGVISLILSKLVQGNLINKLFIFSFIYNLCLFLITTIPIVYPYWVGKLGGHLSDGYKAVKIIKCAKIRRI